jgi:hypothetical protein
MADYGFAQRHLEGPADVRSHITTTTRSFLRKQESLFAEHEASPETEIPAFAGMTRWEEPKDWHLDATVDR